MLFMSLKYYLKSKNEVFFLRNKKGESFLVSVVVKYHTFEINPQRINTFRERKFIKFKSLIS